MNKQEIDAHLAKLVPQVFCKFCSKNIWRREIGKHYRSKSHKENLERSKVEGTYEDLLELYEIYIVVQQFIASEKERE